MNNEIFEKLKELYELINKSGIPNDDCIIAADDYDEANIIGNENAYLRLICFLSELLLYSKQMIPQNDDYDYEEDGLCTSNIKQYFNDYADCFPVAALLQNDSQFSNTVKKTFDDFQNRRR